jgi:hypothetical protein
MKALTGRTLKFIKLKGCFSYASDRTRKTAMSFPIGVGDATAEYGGGPLPSFVLTSELS